MEEGEGVFPEDRPDSPLVQPSPVSQDLGLEDEPFKEKRPRLPPLPNGSPPKPSLAAGKPVRSATIGSSSPPKSLMLTRGLDGDEAGTAKEQQKSPLQRAQTMGLERKLSLSRPWLSGTYDSKSTSVLLESEAVAKLSTRDSGSTLTFASQKRNTEFHELFPLVEKSEFLVEDYSCAWQKEVLVQGRLYLTTKGMHFYAKLLLKWVYQVSIPFETVTGIEKKYDSVSGVFNNSILVSTDSDKFFFASFVNRDETFAQIKRLLDNKSAHKTIPMTTLALKKNESLKRDGPERGAWGEGQDDSTTLASWSAFPVDSEEAKRDIEIVKNTKTRSGANSREQLEAHRRSQSEDLYMKSNQESSASRRRASLNALSRPQSEAEDTANSSFNRNQESGLQRATSVVAKANLIASHSPDLGLIEIARSQEQATSSDIASFHSAPSGPASSHPSFIVHQPKHIIRSPSPSSSPASFETRVADGPSPPPDSPTAELEEEILEELLDEEMGEDVETPPPPPKRSDHPHPVNCTCHKEHTEMKLMLDHTFDTSVEHLWELLFGSKLQESDFGIRFWGHELKYKDIKMTTWKLGTEEVEEPALPHVERTIPVEEIEQGHHRRLSYVVPSTNSLGPKEIKTFVYNQVLFKDHQNHFICVMQTTTTPFVPAGDCFDVKIKTCISHQGPNKTQLKVSCRVNFVKSSWIRIAIERAVPDTLKEYYGKLKNSLESFIAEEAKRMSMMSTTTGTTTTSKTRTSSAAPSLRRKRKMTAKGGTPVVNLEPSSSTTMASSDEEKLERGTTAHPLESELLAMKREEEEALAKAQRQAAHLLGKSASAAEGLTSTEPETGYKLYLKLWRQHQPWLLPLLVSVLLVLALVNTLLLNSMVRTLTEIQRQRTGHTPQGRGEL